MLTIPETEGIELAAETTGRAMVAIVTEAAPVTATADEREATLAGPSKNDIIIFSFMLFLVVNSTAIN